jgi:predicted MFS family arabinose efflux permease
LYATQALLPLLRRDFHADVLAVSLTVSASTLAVALAAPFAGVLSDRLGRRPLILCSAAGLCVPTLMAASSRTLHALILWRFLQGLFAPGIFVVTIAYISEEWERLGVGTAMACYVTGTVLGGFCGRFLSGLVAAHAGWRAAFLVLGGLTLLCWAAMWRWLPPSRRFRPAADWAAPLRAMAGHLRNRALLAAYAGGFCVLFSLVGSFTYITFRLAEAPYRLGPSALGLLFTVYLVGAVITPFTGRLIDRRGCRAVQMLGLATSAAGVLLTLLHPLPLVLLGLSLCATGVFICQSATSSYVTSVAGSSRSSAAGLYVTCYYVGGSVGASAPSFLWSWGGWPAVAMLVLGVQSLTLLLAALFWQERGSDRGASPGDPVVV